MLWLCCLLFMVPSSFLPLSASVNSISINSSISINQTIISTDGKFALGFFSPGNSTSSYLGIWYNTIPKLTVIWVANRASPVPKGLLPVFRVSEDGNLVVLSGRKVVWTSNVSVISASVHSAEAVLLDNGNLVLKHGENDLWQSFDHPTDTIVSGMKMSSNRRTGKQMHLTSWVDDEHPQQDSISINSSISINQTIISAEGKFALGFFSPGNSTSSYLGIWYNTIPKLTVIWVANRASPVPKGSLPVFRVSEDGNLVVLSGRKVVWTSNVSVISASVHSAEAVLHDNGNLVLKHGENDLWQSFDHPTDTSVPGMKMSSNRRTGKQMRLTSWVDDEHPQQGIYSIVCLQTQLKHGSPWFLAGKFNSRHGYKQHG
ncbi:S-locus glycoprotein domain-containing protein [Artemisia annua]|uniref:S-locus glycoprotein domain-containing protein n=1 Tax=Artemisia annua TaxID=35608 RepID=A0A2U1PD84_ARTAN|nr:S-locus glycoprotein domain-containing protein [Artemisia annua]